MLLTSFKENYSYLFRLKSLVFMIDTTFIRSSTNSVEGKRREKPGCWL